MLELLLHHLLDVEHVVCVDFVALNLIQLFQIDLVRLHDQQSLHVGSTILRQDVGLGSKATGFHPLSLETAFDCVAELRLVLGIELKETLHICLQLVAHARRQLRALVVEFVYQLRQFIILLLQSDLGPLLVEDFVVAPDDLVLLLEVQMELGIVRVKLLDTTLEELSLVRDVVDGWQSFDKLTNIIDLMVVDLHADVLRMFLQRRIDFDVLFPEIFDFFLPFSVIVLIFLLILLAVGPFR